MIDRAAPRPRPVVMTPVEAREIMARLGWSGVELARRCHIYPSRVASYLTGRATIPGPLAAYLRLAAQYLVAE